MISEFEFCKCKGKVLQCFLTYHFSHRVNNTIPHKNKSANAIQPFSVAEACKVTTIHTSNHKKQRKVMGKTSMIKLASKCIRMVSAARLSSLAVMNSTLPLYLCLFIIELFRVKFIKKMHISFGYALYLYLAQCH